MKARALTIDQISTDPGIGPAARLAKWSRPGENGCVEWFGSTTHDGYGLCRVRIDGKWAGRGAHRVAYALAFGFIPHYLQVHHRCYNRLCVNPDHLELRTPRENVHDGDSRNPTNANRQKTHCAHGHPYDETNTYLRPSGERLCRECARRNARETARRKRTRLAVALLVVSVFGVTASTAGAASRVPSRCLRVPAVRLCAVHFHKRHFDHYRHLMGLSRVPYQWRAEAHPALRSRILHYWMRMERHAHRRYVIYRHTLQQSPVGAIQAAFGAAASAAIAVATCESTLNVNATNGQYFGLFQLSSYIRYSRPGIPHAGSSTDASLQARAAAAVYRQDGGSWREWSCQP